MFTDGPGQASADWIAEDVQNMPTGALIRSEYVIKVTNLLKWPPGSLLVLKPGSLLPYLHKPAEISIIGLSFDQHMYVVRHETVRTNDKAVDLGLVFGLLKNRFDDVVGNE